MPEVRRDWARYHDMITFMDKQVGGILKQLDDDKLADQTIVFFFSDHGAGLPRSKRWLYDSSLRVPFIVRFPDTWKKWSPGSPGSATDRLVSFLDFAPTVLSLSGVEISKHMQGASFLEREPAERGTLDFATGWMNAPTSSAVRDSGGSTSATTIRAAYFHEQHVGSCTRCRPARLRFSAAGNRPLPGASS